MVEANAGREEAPHLLAVGVSKRASVSSTFICSFSGFVSSSTLVSACASSAAFRCVKLTR